MMDLLRYLLCEREPEEDRMPEIRRRVAALEAEVERRQAEGQRPLRSSPAPGALRKDNSHV